MKFLSFSIAPFMPLNPSVSTISAPYAFKILRLSIVIVSGRVSIALYPFIAATDAIPIPVFPEVGSIIVAPGFKSPFPRHLQSLIKLLCLLQNL